MSISIVSKRVTCHVRKPKKSSLPRWTVARVTRNLVAMTFLANTITDSKQFSRRYCPITERKLGVFCIKKSKYRGSDFVFFLYLRFVVVFPHVLRFSFVSYFSGRLPE